jgi:hypothetical protein
MKSYRFTTIREMVMYSKADMSVCQVDPWAMFRQMVSDFNDNMAAKLQARMTQTLDESMSSYQPRKDKRGGLPNIYFILRKPKPLGIEFKTICDADTRVMMWVEVQEGRTTLRQKTYSRELGTTCAIVLRAMESSAIQHGTTLLGDNWLAAMKVISELMCNVNDNKCL